MAFEGGDRVGVALHAGAQPDLVCIDTGCNRIVLVDLNDIDDYEEEPENSFLRTTQAEARLVIVGRGRVGNNAVLSRCLRIVRQGRVICTSSNSSTTRRNFAGSTP